MNALGVSLDNRYFAPLLEWTKFGLTRISPQEFAMQKHVCSEVQFFWQKKWEEYVTPEAIQNFGKKCTSVNDFIIHRIYFVVVTSQKNLVKRGLHLCTLLE